MKVLILVISISSKLHKEFKFCSSHYKCYWYNEQNVHVKRNKRIILYFDYR